ncbi:MAG: Ig-like domain-containing protein [Treponema sp.]
MKKTRKKQGLRAAAAVFLILFCTTCKGSIGLGGTVDIDRPSITVDSPPIKAVVRNSFTLKGTLKDDVEVSKVNVIISWPGMDKSLVKNASVDNAAGTWSIVLNEPGPDGGFPLKDGTYTFQIQAVDGTGKDSIVDTKFDIDNTPPLLVLTRPSTLSGQGSPDVFGDEFRLEGQVSDLSGASKLSITGTGTDGTEAKIALQNIPPTIRLKVDSFSDEVSPFYRALYGNESDAGEKPFSYTLEITDNAKEYDSPHSDNRKDEGNRTGVYYLYDDIYDLLKEYTVEQLYAYLSGRAETVPAGRSAASSVPDTLKNLKKILKQKAVDGKERKGSFGLNPSKSPRFSIEGYAQFSLDNVSKAPEVYNETPLTIKLTQNLDKVPLRELSKYRFYLIEAQKYKDTYSIKHDFDINDPATFESADFIEIKPEGKKQGGSALFNIILKDTMTDGGQTVSIRYGTPYVLLVAGADIEKNKLAPQSAGVYGFKLVKAGKPEVWISEVYQTADDPARKVIGTGDHNDIIERVVLKKGAPLKVTTRLRASSQAEVTYTLSGSLLSGEKTFTTVLHTGEQTKTEEIFSFGEFNQTESGAYRLKVQAHDDGAAGGGDSITRTYQLYYDVKEPEIQFLNMSDGGLASTAPALKFEVSDAGIGVDTTTIKAKVAYLGKSGNNTAVPSQSEQPVIFADPAYKLEPNAFTAEGDYRIVIEAQDSFGLSARKELTFTRDNGAPRIIPNSIMLDGKTNTPPIYSNKEDISITASAEDTNYLTKIELKAEKAGVSGIVPKSPGAGERDGRWNITESVLAAAGFSSYDGTYELTVTAADAVGNRVSEKRTLVIDTAAPQCTEVKVGGQAVTGSIITAHTASIRLEGKITETLSGLESVKYCVVAQNTPPAADAAEWNLLGLSGTPADGYTVDGYITVRNNEYLHLAARDKAGNELRTRYTLEIDSEAPAAIINVKDVAGGVFHSNTNTYYRKGSFDVELGSSDDRGVASAVLTVKKDGNQLNPTQVSQLFTGYADADIFSTAGGEKKKTYTVASTPALHNGSYVVTLKVTDKASRLVEKTVNITIDNTPPEIQVTAPVAVQQFNTNNPTFSGTIFDAGSQVKELSYQLGTDPAATLIPVNGTSWHTSVNLGTQEGARTVTFTFKDILDNEGTAGPITFYYDKEPPVLSGITVNSQTSAQVVAGVESLGSTTQVKNFTVTGKVQDSWQMKSVTVSLTKAGNTAYKKDLYPTAPITSTDTLQDWSVPVTHADLSGADGTYTMTITAEDQAGRKTIQTRTVEIDNTPPSVSFETPAPYARFAPGTVTLKGNASDANGLASVELFKKTAGGYTSLASFAGTGAYNWSYALAASSSDTGELELKAVAIDKAGNKSETPLVLVIDNTAPNAPALVSGDAAPKELSEWSYTFKGTASDQTIPGVTDGASGSGISKVTYKAGGAADESTPSDVQANLTAPSGGEYTWKAPVSFSAEQDNYVHVWVYDGVGNRTYKKFGPYTVNTSAPLIETILVNTAGVVDYDLKAHNSLVLNDTNKNSVKLKIQTKTQVAGKTIHSVKVKIGNGTSLFVRAPIPIPNPKVSGTWTCDLTNQLNSLPDSADGLDIEVTVRDTPVPYKTTAFKGKLYLDKTDPEVSLITPANNAVVNNTVTIKGSSSDNREIAKLTITEDDGSTAGSPLTGVSGSSGDSGDSTVFSGNKAYNWSFKLNTADYPDGALKLKATAVDMAGNEKPETFTFMVDNTAPNPAVLTNAELAAVPASEITFFGESAFVFKGTASDQQIGSTAAGSGISKVMYKALMLSEEPASGAPSAEGALTAKLNPDNTWEANVNFTNTSQKYYLHVWVFDGAGNATHTRFGKYAVDTALPAINEIKVYTREESGYDLKQNISLVVGETSKNNVQFKIKAASHSGIASVAVSPAGGTSVTASQAGGVWTASLTGSHLTTLAADGDSQDVEIIVESKSIPKKRTSFTAKLYLDKKEPEVNLILPQTDSVINKTVLFKGTANDNREIAKLTITKENDAALTGVSESTGDEPTKAVFTGDNARNWSFKLDTAGSEYTTGSFTLKAIAEDKYGNRSTPFFTFTLDKTAPNAPALVPGDAAPKVLSEWSYTFSGTASDQTIPGVTDGASGSGISKVTYKAGLDTNEENSPSDVQAKLTAPSGSETAYKWEANVYFNNAAGNYLHVWVYDGAGNPRYKKFGPYTVNTSAPLIEAVRVKMKDDSTYDHDLKANNSVVLGRLNKDKVMLEITAKTEVQGRSIASVEVTAGSTTIEAAQPSPLPAANASGTWTADLSSVSELTGWDTNNTEKVIRITVKDSPNPQKLTVLDAKFMLDTEYPKVTFSSPCLDSANAYTVSDVNKTITISGSISDTKAAKSIKIVKSDGSPLTAGVTGRTQFTVPLAYNWSFKLDTTAYTDNAPLQLKAVVQDMAGNTTEQPFTLNINQDADRPVIRVNSFTSIENLPSNSPSLTGSRVLSGTVTDDDGNLKNLASDLQIKVGTGSYVNVVSSAGGALWTYEIPNSIADGNISLDFQVKDAEGAIFTTGTGTGAALIRPKVLGKDDELSKARDGSITFKLDTKKPEFRSQAHSFVLGGSFPSGNNGTPFGANAIIGNKNSKTASFRVWVKDDIADGIASVTLSIGSGTVQTGTANPSANAGGYEAWDITNVALPDSAEGNPDIKIIATDKSSFNNEISVPVIVDFTAPVIEHQSPVLDGIYFNEVNLSGIITDTAPNNARASGVKTETIEFKIGDKDDTNYSYGTAHNHGSEEFSSLIKTASSWTVKISDISKYKGLTSVIGPSGSSSIHILPITIRGKDNAGNVSEEKTYKIKFDPNGGTPTLTVVSPKKVMKAGVETGESIGGDVVISGSAAVANPASGKFVTEITLQLRKDGQSFGTSWMLDGKDYGSGHVIAANSTGIQYWNHVLTQAVRNGIFAPLPSSTKSVAVYLRVKGKNNVGTDGDWSAERKFILSKDVAEFYEIKLDGENYAPNGKWIKGNDFNITGKVKHNSGIKNDLHAASESVPAGVQSLNTSGTTNGFNPQPTAITDGSDSGYSFTVPIKTNGYEQKSGYIEFDITATDGRTQDYQTVKSKIMLKYDNSKPAAVFGRAAGKFNKAAFTDSAASGVLVNLEGTETVQQAVERLKKNLENLVLFAETKDGSAKAVKVTNLTAQGSYARAEFASTTDFASSAACILLEQNPIVFDRTSTNYQLQGFAYDTGSKTKTIKIEFGSTDKGSITRFDPESGNFVSFTQDVETKTLADGKHILKLTPADDAGNTGDVYSCDVFVRNKPLKIINASFSTDLNGSGGYSNDPVSGLVETVTKAGDGSLDSVQNYSQTLDITNEFTLKKADKSQIKFALSGGAGNHQFALYKIDPSVNSSAAAVKSGNLTGNEINFAPTDFGSGTNEIPEGDNQKFFIVLTDAASQTDAGRKLLLTVTLNVKTNDTRKPSVFISPFYWNAEDDNSLASNDRTKGHIEIKKVSTGAGESDVSGSVVLRGTAYHPTKLTKLTLKVNKYVGTNPQTDFEKTETYTSGSWTSSNGLTVKDIRLDVNGHWVEWEYTWTTSDVGKKDISIKAYHNTVVSGDSNAGTVTRKTAVTRSSNQSLQLASGDTAVPGQVLRIVDTVTSGSGSIDGDVSYLVTITSVEGDVVKWEHITVPARFTDYYLYPVGYAGDEPSFNKPAMSVNVVPYVTGIKTALSRLGGANDPNLYARTALGRYPVQDKEKIEIQGFNLSGAAVTVGGVASGTLSGTASPWELTLAAGAKSGALELTAGSGSNAVSAINNLTDNAKLYNKAKKTASNDKLTDDLYLDVWEFNSQAAKPHRGVITEPVMRINPSNGMIGFAFANGPDYFSMSKGISNSYTKWQRNYDDYGNVDFVYDSVGKSHGVVVGRDINSGGNQGGKFAYFTSQWGTGSVSDQGANYNGQQSLRLESIGQVDDMNGSGGAILDKTRIQHPSLAAAKRTANETRVYLAYYDGINDQIRFKYGTIPDSLTYTSPPANNENPSPTRFGLFVDEASKRAVQPYSQDNVSIVAGEYKSGSAVVNTGNTTGTYLSLGVVSGTTAASDTAVLIWFDETNRMLKYTYKTNPQNGNHASQSGNGSGNWKKPIDVFDKMNVGEYCKIAVDKAGGIHIAAFDSDSADLKYAYLSSYNAASFQTATVDSYGITGTHITLDVAYTAAAGKPVPYIGYYSASAGRSKLAYLVDTATGVSGSAQGTDDSGYFTGKWEVSVVPTARRVQQDNINVGVWKTAGGVIKNSVTGANNSGTENGTVHGNGTDNPVLGYAIRQAMNGYIETAQKK